MKILSRCYGNIKKDLLSQSLLSRISILNAIKSKKNQGALHSSMQEWTGTESFINWSLLKVKITGKYLYIYIHEQNNK